MVRPALLGLTTFAFLALAAGCGGDGETDVEFTRADGSVAQLSDRVRAWCGPYDEDNEDVEAVHVLAGEPPPASYWLLAAVRADIARDPETELPNDFVYTKPAGSSIFVLDAEDRENELSSAEEESSGTIRVESDGCELGDSVAVTFDGVVLGSEYHDLPRMSVSGGVVAEIGKSPDQ